MTSQAEKMLVDENGIIDYEKIIKKYSWLIEKDQDCILSPDSDGLLCGLLMSHYLNWKVRGFYDGKILLLEKGFHVHNCVFLDMEIFRKEVKSVGQHMVLFNKNHPPSNWKKFDNCLSANNLRGYDGKHNFPQKYPLGTIHLLLGILGSIEKIEVPETAICPLLYTDGTFKNLFSYPENCLNWLKFLKADNEKGPLHAIFFNNHYSTSSLMIALNNLFNDLRLITGGKRGGDKIKISNGKGELLNFNEETNSFEQEVVEQIEKFLKLLMINTEWNYNSDHWSWNNLSCFKFEKGSITPSQGRYDQLMKNNPLSLAMTGGLSIEYTLDKNNII